MHRLLDLAQRICGPRVRSSVFERLNAAALRQDFPPEMRFWMALRMVLPLAVFATVALTISAASRRKRA